MADIFDVISDPTRRDLLGRLLANRLEDGQDADLAVGVLVEQTGLSQPTVSKHLKVLRDQGLVLVRDEAQHRYYRIDPAPLAEVEEWLAPFAIANGHAGVPAASGDESRTPLIAWSGAGAGERIGRVAADTAHQAQAVLQRLESVTAKAKAQLAEAADFLGR
jgi:DNA-binding transcriptional ArsR family regulator